MLFLLVNSSRPFFVRSLDSALDECCVCIFFTPQSSSLSISTIVFLVLLVVAPFSCCRLISKTEKKKKKKKKNGRELRVELSCIRVQISEFCRDDFQVATCFSGWL